MGSDINLIELEIVFLKCNRLDEKENVSDRMYHKDYFMNFCFSCVCVCVRPSAPTLSHLIKCVFTVSGGQNKFESQ